MIVISRILIDNAEESLATDRHRQDARENCKTAHAWRSLTPYRFLVQPPVGVYEAGSEPFVHHVLKHGRVKARVRYQLLEAMILLLQLLEPLQLGRV